VREAEFWKRKHFSSLKIKVGADVDHNVAAISAIRDAVGSEMALRIDANGSMDMDGALAFAEAIAGLDIEFIEQPVNDTSDLVRLASSSPVRIAADESIVDARNFATLLQQGALHVANIKINKFGGVTTSRKLVALADAYGVPCMVGCMSETPISIAASLHLALSSSNVAYADLDTFMFLKHSPASGLKMKKGVLQPTRNPGLGIDVDDSLYKGSKLVEYKKAQAT
jgi:L-alanine-DL-glutamate epimerase-like enolase superfamily enzyme